MANESNTTLHDLFAQRYSDPPDPSDPVTDKLQQFAGRGSCRSYSTRPVPMEWTEALCATALASPTKSDLQQRDIIVLNSVNMRSRLSDLVPGQPWVKDAPVIAVFCGNNRRQRLLHKRHDIPFANDHLDALVNAVGDAAIAMGAFVTAAEALGLGCCPISAVRNDAAAVSRLLELPDHVFPFAGLAFGFPREKPMISKRLPLGVTCHIDTFKENNLIGEIANYDGLRARSQPYRTQRFPEKFPPSDQYTWSEDKARQYSEPERETFGRYIRAAGFNLD